MVRGRLPGRQRRVLARLLPGRHGAYRQHGEAHARGIQWGRNLRLQENVIQSLDKALIRTKSVE